MWLLFGVLLAIALLFFILGWAIRRKKAYWLISGFSTRPEEEQKQLIENGWPQKTGALLMATAIGMILLLPLTFTPFQYAMEVQFGFMTFFLLGGYIYLSRYETPKKRKRSFILSSTLFVLVFGFISVLFFIGNQSPEMVIEENSFEITGLYGGKWNYDDIEKIKLLEKMPEVTWRENGFGLASMSKGHFTVEGYGSCLLFIRHGVSPYLYIELKNGKIFINGENSRQTKSWYEQIREGSFAS